MQVSFIFTFLFVCRTEKEGFPLKPDERLRKPSQTFALLLRPRRYIVPRYGDAYIVYSNGNSNVTVPRGLRVSAPLSGAKKKRKEKNNG